MSEVFYLKKRQKKFLIRKKRPRRHQNTVETEPVREQAIILNAFFFMHLKN